MVVNKACVCLCVSLSFEGEKKVTWGSQRKGRKEKRKNSMQDRYEGLNMSRPEIFI